MITTIIVYKIITLNISDSYIKTSSQRVIQKYQNFDLYTKLTEETAKLISNNEKILEILDYPQSDYSIETLLDGMKSTDAEFNIISIFLYSSTGANYRTSNINYMPTLDALIKDMNLQAFINSKQESIWCVRTKNIFEEIRLTGSNNYKPDYGMITHLSKIYDNNKTLKGYLVINVHINKLYKSFTPNKTYSFDKSSCYIIQDGEILPYPSSSANLSDKMKIKLKELDYNKDRILYENNIILQKKLSNSLNTHIISVIPLDPILYKFYNFMVIIFIVSAIFITVIIITGKILSKSITSPLNQLLNKMQHPL